LGNDTEFVAGLGSYTFIVEFDATPFDDYRIVYCGCAGGGNKGIGLILDNDSNVIRTEIYGSMNGRQTKTTNYGDYLNQVFFLLAYNHSGKRGL